MKPTFSALLIFTTLSIHAFAESPDKDKRKASVTAPIETPAVALKNVTPDELEKLLQDNPKVVILDIRTPQEFEMGHIKGATNLDFMEETFDNGLSKLDKNTPVVIYCGSGSRSTRALPKFKQQQFLHVFHLNSGFKSWTEAGKSVTPAQK